MPARVDQRGFTLIELMIVMAILGVISSLAIPAFLSYVDRAKTAEARGILATIADGARAYYNDPPAEGTGLIGTAPKQVPAGTQPYTADSGCCAMGGGTDKCAPDDALWDTEIWNEIGVSVADPHYFAYAYEGDGDTQSFVASARGDASCTGNFRYFAIGAIRPEGASDLQIGQPRDVGSSDPLEDS